LPENNNGPQLGRCLCQPDSDICPFDRICRRVLCSTTGRCNRLLGRHRQVGSYCSKVRGYVAEHGPLVSLHERTRHAPRRHRSSQAWRWYTVLQQLGKYVRAYCRYGVHQVKQTVCISVLSVKQPSSHSDSCRPTLYDRNKHLCGGRLCKSRAIRVVCHIHDVLGPTWYSYRRDKRHYRRRVQAEPPERRIREKVMAMSSK